MAVLAGLAGCVAGPPDGGRSGAAESTRSSEERAALERKIGQMVLVGFRGMSVDDAGPVVEQIRAGQVGGVVLFDFDALSGEPVRNIRSPEQVRALVDGLQQAADEVLFVAVDEEGGRVARLKERYGFPPTVSQRELAQRGLASTREQSRQTAVTLRQVGVNVNLAPVVDLDVDPEGPAIGALGRSFSADPGVVTEHARAVVQSHREQGVRTAVKHFPGHGSANADSHRGFVDVSDTWSTAELSPYRTLISDRAVDMVMTAHVLNRNVDPEWPATLSPPTITGLLRERLGYDGVVVADDMQMGAIAEHYGLETALRQAIVSGVDVVTFANNNRRVYEPDIAPKVIGTIARLVEDGTISEARIDESLERIRILKQRLQQ